MPDPICPTGTTYVPGGRFKDGTKVKGVCINIKPVSNKSYLKSFGGFPVRKNTYTPVIFVSYNDARKYCQSRGMRLPTEIEWVWAFNKSKHSLSMMGMKNQSGKLLWEIVTSVIRRGIRSQFVAIAGRPVDSGRFVIRTSYWSPLPKYLTPTRRRALTFRCAVEPDTYWAKQITALVDGLVLFFARAILGWENPR